MLRHSSLLPFALSFIAYQVVVEGEIHPRKKAMEGQEAEVEVAKIKLMLLAVAVDMLSADYIPSDVDIRYDEHVTSSNGLSSVDFSFPPLLTDETNDTTDEHNSLLIVQSRGYGENCKWLEMFEDARVVIICASLSDFHRDFKPIVSRNSHKKNISRNNINHSPSMGQMASHYVAVKFKKLYASASLTNNMKLFVSVVKGLDPNSVDQTLNYAREILKWDEEKPNFNFNEYSMYSSDGSSNSQ
ncbi:hypothetical protein L2E82_06570 [Cichorium intybus]|uniref:Uncharacterized protein n=1 Tax=Cichorium intybus TaxID=13427 RepID=A0ACB9HAE4_CICIN|nr:hypothetical protein L2E82_06570 [Cichorium intybus]